MEISLALLEAIAKANPGNFAIYRLDQGALHILFRSASLPSLAGLDEEEYNRVSQDNATALVLPADRAGIQKAMAECLTTHQDINITYRIFHKGKNFV